MTSLDGDARYDIQESIHDRYPAVEIMIADARVQGDHAPESIADGIHRLDRTHEVDVIVVGRGGGSETDLEAFSTEPVAEAVFTAETAVVAAVGHREDEPIVGDVADANAITPTEAGSIVVQDRRAVEEDIAMLGDRLESAYTELVDSRLETLGRGLDDAYEAAVDRKVTDLQGQLDDAYIERKQAIEKRATRKRYGAVIAVLVVLVLVLLGIILFTLLYP